MKQTLLLEAMLGQTRLAVLEQGRLRELYCERPDSDNLVGSIYLGRVENVLPGMNAAFVDIGIPKNAFLPSSEAQGQGGGKRIEQLVHPGQTLLLQVNKAAVGDKGPRVTTMITLAGRVLALMPFDHGVGVSRRIADEAERTRLRTTVEGLLRGTGMGAIVRTAAEGADKALLESEINALSAVWERIRQRAEHAIAPKRLHSDASLALHAMRDLMSEDVEAVWTDSTGAYGLLREYAALYAPQWQERIHLHQGEEPLFDLHRIDTQLEDTLKKRVWLRSGGFLVIEETEALTVIDVNTGKYTGKTDLEDTIFKLNCEAAEAVMAQLRLRDIGGIVVVDFIDMAGRDRREALLARLRELAALDRNRTAVVDMTSLGLVEITRRRARQSLARQLTHDCTACGGSGAELTHETVARRALREVWRRRRRGEEGPLLIEAAEPVTGWMRTIGAPAGGDTYARAIDMRHAGETRISPVDPANLPKDAQLLKRG